MSKNKKRNKILTQGILDGLCLLYAVMNAYKTISNASSSASTFLDNYHNKWKKIISLTPSLQNFTSGEGSEFGLVTDNANKVALENLLSNYAAAFSDSSTYKYTVSNLEREDLSNHNFGNSALVFCLKKSAKTEYYTDANHWVCCIGIEGQKLLLQCSHTYYELENSYKEFCSENFKSRLFNNRIKISEIDNNRIYSESIYSIKREAGS